MKHSLIIKLALLLSCNICLGQGVPFEIDGSIKIGASMGPSPDSGTIQWTGSDFEVWQGGEWVSMTGGGEDVVRDINNNSYGVVTIGSQVWMTENLRTTHYNDGTEIHVVTDDATWSTLTTDAYTWHKDTDTRQGFHYNYAVVDASNPKNVCPTGWHVPSSTEFQTLSNFYSGIHVAGGKLKQTGLSHWELPNTSAANTDGFTAVASGYRSGVDGTFHSIRESLRLWSSTFSENITGGGWYYGLNHSTGEATLNETDGKNGFSIRCIKD